MSDQHATASTVAAQRSFWSRSRHRLGRGAVALAAAGVTAGGAVLGAPAASAADLPSNCTQDGQIVYCDFAYTGAAQSFVVPAGVSSVTVSLNGAQGGTIARREGGGTPGQGGLGAHVRSTLAVTPGETLPVLVGGTANGTSGGGFNGGGAGGAFTNGAATGGGATDVRRGGGDLGNRVLIAAGGGGGGDCSVYTCVANGGAGGASNATGGAGQNSVGDSGGKGGGAGTATAGGAPGAPGASAENRTATPGYLGYGGSGASAPGDGGDGGGGGGGLYGGGGGGAGGQTSPGGGGGGGGGGSNLVTGTNTLVENGANTGNGSARISYSVAPAGSVRVTGSGTLPLGTENATFSVNITSNGGSAGGTCSLQGQTTSVTCTSVYDVRRSGNTVTFRGTGLYNNRQPISFTAQITDGTPDSFRIFGAGQVYGGNLTSGNITIS